MSLTKVGPSFDNLSKSQKESAYFNMESSYDPLVYENTWGNVGVILGMLTLFYFIQGMHWWCNFALGIHASETSLAYNLIIFATAIIVIGLMLYFGSIVNVKKTTHEYYAEQISVEKIKQAET